MENFSALLVICVGNSLVTSECPSQRPVTQSFDVFFDLRLNKRLSKQSWGWWFETPSCPLCRHRNGSHVQRDSSGEMVSMTWRHHVLCSLMLLRFCVLLLFTIDSLVPGKSGSDLKVQFAILFYWLISSDLLVMPSDECQRNLLMIRQHWFR